MIDLMRRTHRFELLQGITLSSLVACPRSIGNRADEKPERRSW